MMAFQRGFGRGGGALGGGGGQEGDGSEAPSPRPRLKRPQTDHGTEMIRFMRNWKPTGMRLEAERPSPSYTLNMTAPLARKANGATTVPAKHLHSSLNKQKHPINAIKWTPDGRRLLTGNSSGEFTLWNGMGFNFETLMQAHDSAIRAFAWSHDDEWLLSADQDGLVKFWQSNFNPVNTLEAHKGYAIRDLVFSNQDTKFITASDDTTLKIWDFGNTSDNVTTLKGHGWDVKSVDYHPYKGLVVSGSKDHTVKLWDPRSSGRCLTTLTGQATISTVRFEPQRGNGLAIAARNNVLRCFDLRFMRDVMFCKGHDRDIMTLCWHPIHANLLSTGGADGALYHYLLDETNVPDGSDIAPSIPVCDSPDPMNAPTQSIWPAHRINHAHDSAIWALDWHPLGHVLASGSNDRVTRFWGRPRPGDTDCFNDRYHLGEAGAEAHGTWTRKARRQQQLDDDDPEGEDGEDALIDQRMPAPRPGIAASAGLSGLPGLSSLPGLPGLNANGDSAAGAQQIPNPILPVDHLQQFPLNPQPSMSFETPGIPHPAMLEQMPPEARERFFEMMRNGTLPPPTNGSLPPPLPGNAQVPSGFAFPPPPPLPQAFPGQFGGGQPPFPGIPHQPPMPPQDLNDAARRRRTPLPSQKEALDDMRRRR